MKKFSKFLSIFLLLCTIVCCFGSCENIFQTTTDGGEEEFKYVDYIMNGKNLVEKVEYEDEN